MYTQRWININSKTRVVNNKVTEMRVLLAVSEYIFIITRKIILTHQNILLYNQTSVITLLFFFEYGYQIQNLLSY